MTSTIWINPEWGKWKKSVTGTTNDDFIHIQTESGVRGYRLSDPKATEHILDPKISDKDLGLVVLEALKNSRELSLEEASAIDKNSNQDYENYIQNMMHRFGYKTKNALFRKMRYCDMRCEEGIITIEPWHHERLESWNRDYLTEKDIVKINIDSPPEEIGAALRLAFNNCTGMGAIIDYD
jgi:hypothetical protein